MSAINKTVVAQLRKASERLSRAVHDGDVDGRIFFPKPEGSETQPVTLEGYVPTKSVADLIHYIADMLEE